MLLSFSTELPHKYCQEYKDPSLDPLDTPYKINVDSIKEKFDDMAEEFLDEVFEYESTISRAEWENDLA